MTRLELRRWGLLVVILVGAAASSATLAAQTVTGSISGTVVDAQGAVMPAATVTILNEATGAPRVAVTDARGDFQVTNLQAGRYTVRVEITSFRPYERKNVVVSSSERVAIGTIALELGSLTDTVSVEATGTHVNTDRDAARRRHHPDANRTDPGARPRRHLAHAAAAGGPLHHPGRLDGQDRSASTCPTSAACRRDWSKVIIDGVVGNEVGNSGMQAQMVNLDAIAEVRLLNNSYRAEYGQSGGSQLQIVTRGGTSEYRGSGYWYVRNEKLNSTEFFRARSQRLNGIEPFPRYRFNTYGANLGGPVVKGKNKVFFFYSLEAPHRQSPAERADLADAVRARAEGRLLADARRPGTSDQHQGSAQVRAACNAVTGGPGCFEGNIIPASMINPAHMQAMLNLMPLPEYDPRTTQGNYNYDSEEITDNAEDEQRRPGRLAADAERQPVVHVQGLEAGPARHAHSGRPVQLGVVQRSLHEYRPRLHRQLQQGAAVQHGVGHRLRDAAADGAVLPAERDGVGQDQPAAGRLQRRAVPSRAEPAQRAAARQLRQRYRQRSPNFTFDNRLVDQGEAWLSSVRSNLTYIRGAHSLKTGMYYEDTRNSEGKGGVGGGSWAGDFNFGVDTNNPLDTNYAYANALLGNINSYTETNGYADVRGQRPSAEAYVQDTWKPLRNLTVDYGARFLWYRPWASFKDTKSASFVPDRYDPGGSPLLYQPVLVNGQQRALNPVTGELRPYIYVGGFVPGTGDPYNGMVTQDEWGSYGTGFRVSQGIEPEGRAGLAWDITGNGKTSLHASIGLYHNPYVNANGLDTLARNPPAQSNPVLRYSTIDHDAHAGRGGGVRYRPSSGILGLQHDAPTPKSLNYSVGIQREIGWGTVLDVTYAGSRTRNIEVSYNINDLPYGTNFIDVHPENINPATGTVLPADFLRPYLGYGTIAIRQNTGETDYNSMQVQLNRRYINGLQFALAYTLAKGWDTRVTSPYQTEDWFNRAPTAGTQLHNLTVSYTWDVPDGSRLGTTSSPARALDGWQLSGNTAFVSGDWAGVTFTTTDNFDFYGGGARRPHRPDRRGPPRRGQSGSQP